MIRFVLTKYNYDNLLVKIKALDLTKRWRVNISEEKVVRSLEQNERLWSLYGSIANYIGEDPSTVHELLGYKFLRYQTEIAGNAVELVKSTTKLTTKEMTEYQENCERWLHDTSTILHSQRLPTLRHPCTLTFMLAFLTIAMVSLSAIFLTLADIFV